MINKRCSPDKFLAGARKRPRHISSRHSFSLLTGMGFFTTKSKAAFFLVCRFSEENDYNQKSIVKYRFVNVANFLSVTSNTCSSFIWDRLARELPENVTVALVLTNGLHQLKVYNF
jgi:hypothetical protein